MTVKNVLRNSLMMYPSLYRSKFQVYEHLFLVCGNGYDWVNGELVSSDTKRPCTKKQAIDKIMNWEYAYDIQVSLGISELVHLFKTAATTDESEYRELATEYREECVRQFKQENKERTVHINQILDVNKIINEEIHYVVDESAEKFGWKNTLYPLCEYAKILNIPADIKPDWKAAIKEFYDYLMTSDVDVVRDYREKYMLELKSVEEKLK